MADVFVSYSRRDDAFVRQLVERLESRGKDVWVDVAGIRDAEVFPTALRSAVEGSDGFVFVISPDSVSSRFCEQEVAHALELNKRIVPVLLRAVPDDQIPEGIRVRNWIPAGDGDQFELAVERLVGALDTDLAWAKEHTRWLLKALEWEGENRDRSFLLRGSELAAAEQWLASAADKEPQPIPLQTEYVVASRMAASRRQRALMGASLLVAAVALGLLVFALISRNQAINARNTAKSQALAAESQTQLAVDPERSILLAVSALHDAATPEAFFALRRALDASTIRYRLPDAGIQSCGFVNFTAPGIAFRPDGRQLAEGLCDGSVVLADGRTGRVTRRIRVGHFGGTVAYNSDGSLLAATSDRGLLIIDPATGAIRGVAPHPQGRMRIAFSPNAPLLAIANNGSVTLWNVRTRRTRVLRFPPAAGGAPAYALAFSADGKRLVVGLEVVSPTTPGLLVLDVASGRTLRMRTYAHVAVADVAFAPDGEHVAVAQTLLPFGNGRIVLLDAHTLAGDRTLATLPGVDATAVAFRPDGSAVAFGGADGTAGLVSVQTGQPIASYLGQTAAINQVAFSPDGRIVATASTDGTTRVWRARGQEQQSILAGGAVAGLATLAGGVEAIVAKDDRARHTFVVQTWSNPAARPGKPLEISPTNVVNAVFLSGDGRLAAIIPLPRGLPKAPIQIWNVAKRRVTTVPPLTTPFGGEPVFSPGGSSIAMGIPPEGTAVAGPPTKPPSTKPPPGARPKRPQPEMVVVDVRTGKSRRLGTTACGIGWKSQPFSPDGKLLAAGSFCGQVYVWNLASGRQVGRPLSIGGELADIAFSPDATRIAIASWNSTITIADVRTGHVVAVLTDHTRGVTNVAYSPDGRYLASASLDHTARVWDAHTLRLVRILDHPDSVYNLAFSSDGRELVTNDAARVIRVWDTCTACGDRAALLALAKARVTRALTAQEARTFLVR
ncbi:MAG: TIR domain-containing protein [Actinomycetota bacterium]|nr:TIR domain-containing protein [Actinomycetota bacterium]